jgi:Protein of unknown function (DUF2798)
MQGKAKLIYPVLTAGQMVLMVTLVATYLNLGWRSDFLFQWMKAWLVSWPVAAVTAFIAMPIAQRATMLIVRLLENAA